jgi:RNA polymerase sigma factor (sigma-70 family)
LNRINSFGSDEQLSALMDDLMRARIRRAIKELAPIERQIIRWRFGIGCTHLTKEEIAERLNIDPSAVWRILSRGLEDVGYVLVCEVAA